MLNLFAVCGNIGSYPPIGDGTLTDGESRLHRKQSVVRVMFPIIRKHSVYTECDCASYDACVSNGVDVRPRCGCQVFSDDTTFCYVAGVCPNASPSSAFVGASYRPCVGPPPPPPAPLSCTDPLYPAQWHIETIRARGAWIHSRGVGSTVVIVDDGIQYSHPDLQVDQQLSFGFDPLTGARMSSANDPLARHGTAAAGVTSAVPNNNRGGCGIAPAASLAAVKLLPSTTVDTTTTYTSDDAFVSSIMAFFHREQTVLSNSWGPRDDKRVEGPGIQVYYTRVNDVLWRFGTEGRVGKGGITVFAAGNGGMFDNANDDGFASHPHTIAVGAVGDDGRRTPYSEPGACIDLVAPSDGGWRAIATADLTDKAGYSHTNETEMWGGTSAATPIVSATIALMLSVRPDLSLRDVRHILQTTSVKTDPEDDSWRINGANRWFSVWYGFGLLDASAAVTRALNWTTLNISSEVCSVDWVGRQPLVDVEWLRIPLTVSSEVDMIDYVRLYVDIDHPWRSDVLIRLVSPHGTQSDITMQIPRVVPLYNTSFVNHTFLSHAFSGEMVSRASWMLEIHDVSRQGYLRRASLCITGDITPSHPSLPTDIHNTRIVLWSIIGTALVLACGCVCYHRFVRSDL